MLTLQRHETASRVFDVLTGAGVWRGRITTANGYVQVVSGGIPADELPIVESLAAHALRKWSVTYDVITPESAEHGDTDEAGYVAIGMSLRDAIAQAGIGPGGWEDAGRWYATVDGATDYQTGAVTRYAIHPPESITRASYSRVSRLLCGR